MSVALDVPFDLGGRGIFPAASTRGFRIALDTAEPWPGGTIAGRVEITGAHDPRPITVTAACLAAWVDVAPQVVGKGPRFSLALAYDARARRRPIWLDEVLWSEAVEVGTLEERNWLPFSITIPAGLPRACEATFAAFRYTLEASRPRRAGHSTASLPIILVEKRTEPVVRVERTPTASWRLIEWRAPEETGGLGGAVEIAFDERRDVDRPRPGETPEEELRRRVYGSADSPVRRGRRPRTPRADGS